MLHRLRIRLAFWLLPPACVISKVIPVEPLSTTTTTTTGAVTLNNTETYVLTSVPRHWEA